MNSIAGNKLKNQHKKIPQDFYERDVLEVAPELLGKILVLHSENELFKYRISDVEAYRGEEDLACHASKGRTKRTETMYAHGGVLYIYLIYGMYWMMNIVTGKKDQAQAVLIRGLKEVQGPGRLTRLIGIDRSYNGESLVTSERIWLEEGENVHIYNTGPRIGIDYAGDIWKEKAWRFFI